jgi:hypothetical protein
MHTVRQNEWLMLNDGYKSLLTCLAHMKTHRKLRMSVYVREDQHNGSL